MGKRITDEQKQKAIEVFFAENTEAAKGILRDPDKLDELLRALEEKLAGIPAVGGALSSIPLLVSLIRSYALGRYTDIPIGSLAAVVGALTYFLSPVDVIPDFIPLIGHADDAAVVVACLKLVKDDLEKYKAWRDCDP